MTDRLKSCPLCDGEAEWKNGHIICKKCGLSFRAFSYDLTNKKWNTRKPMERIKEKLVNAAESGTTIRESGVTRTAMFVEIADAIKIIEGEL